MSLRKTLGVYGQFVLMVKFPGDNTEGYLLVDGVSTAVKLDKTIFPKIFKKLEDAYSFGIHEIFDCGADRFSVVDWLSQEKYPAVLRAMLYQKQRPKRVIWDCVGLRL